MNVIVIASIVIVLTLLFGALIAVLVRGFSRAVNQEQIAMEAERSSYNAGLTIGHSIPVVDDYDAQLKAARKLAAKRAAQMPRGGNLGIGLGIKDKQRTVFDGLDNDPVSAVKIARFHGWQGLRTGSTTTVTAATAGTKAPAQSVAPVKSADDLVPGKDYPYIEITDEMSPAEKRKAKIANAKAKSAAVKALKQSAPATAAIEATDKDVGQPAVETPSAEAAGEPVPGKDYEVIEITDDMSPDEVRKARIANAKAKSAAMKALKATGEVKSPPPSVEEPIQVVEGQPSLTPEVDEVNRSSAVSTDATSIPVDIPQPNLVEITDDMDPAEVRKARIHNAKERAAYNKALKEAGIDPATVA